MPVYASIETPKRRMSGSVFDAEKRGRVEIGTAALSADDHPVNSALEWKNGNGAYTASPGASSATVATCVPVRAKRPCVHRTAFGRPVEPDVKMRRNRSSSCTGASGYEAGCDATRAAYSALSIISTRSSATSVSTPSSSVRDFSSVTSSWQSVCRTSIPSWSPRYVELTPTMTAPDNAAAVSQKR